jgi:oxygen-independent coproporphyrinogen III oxidase
VHLDPDLLKRYDRPGPRYTSYPTAVEFHDAVGPHTAVERLRALGDAGDAAGLYLHLPFCEARCHYCACNVVVSPLRERVVAPYLDALEREIALTREALGRRIPIVQLHLGGGTPTYHAPDELERILSAVRAHMDVQPDAECSVEIDPRVTTRAHLETLFRHGFRWLSIGVQDTDPIVQGAIGRVQPNAINRAVVDAARAVGFTSVNVDLIYGLPYQTPQTIRQTVRDALELGADRLAVYSFAWVPTARGHQRRMPVEALPDAEAKMALLLTLHECFDEAGYVSIGIDHFAHPEDELAVAQRNGTLGRTFMGYTTTRASDWIGLGVSAIGYVRGAYLQNTRKLSRYEAALSAGELPVERGVELNADDTIRAHVIRELMCNFRIDKHAVSQQFAIAFDQYFEQALSALAPYVEDGLVDLDSDAICATDQGRAFTRNLAMCFDAYRASGTCEGFSRTV